MKTLAFDEVARTPAPGDNAAIATRRIDAGTLIKGGPQPSITLAHTVLEGHRFVIRPIPERMPLTSWGLPFGLARSALSPGEYVCNAGILKALKERGIDHRLPDSPNFEDRIERYDFDRRAFEPGQQVERAANPRHFLGYRRAGGRKAGTRNCIAIIAATVREAGFVEALARRLKPQIEGIGSIDRIVAITHTEGGHRADSLHTNDQERPHNYLAVLRCLAGFCVHPNIAATLVCDYGTGTYTGEDIERFLCERGDDLDTLPHRFFRIRLGVESALDEAERIVKGWIPEAAAAKREPLPLDHLKVALQCGGSDAFSGISGNPLAGRTAREIIRHGGSAVLAETDELIGAEPYILSNVRDIATALRFLERIEAFKTYAGHHGATAEGNPSGGNKFRGLYNITLKSIGAARKRDPDVRLDHVIDYAAPMHAPGFYFMDSPGNDLESIAGQVASGANLIFFITGNGSITNFPFVPTLKFVTTGARFRMLEKEMDVNAGRYLDGQSMESLADETFALACKIASGEADKGERAGHAQVQIWREWPQAGESRIEAIREAKVPDGRPLATLSMPPLRLDLQLFASPSGPTADRIALVMPTSLCSGQPARLIADALGSRYSRSSVSRFVSLTHSEGCGSANAQDIHLRTLLSHLRHRFVDSAVLLEHGCEKTHNDAVRRFLAERGEDIDRYGFAGIQLDGGLEGAKEKVGRWFDHALRRNPPPMRQSARAKDLRLGILTTGDLADFAARVLCRLAGKIVAAGGSVFVCDRGAFAKVPPRIAGIDIEGIEIGRKAKASEGLVGKRAWRDALLADPDTRRATLAFGERAETDGLHVIEMPTNNALEMTTAIGAAGAETMLAWIGDAPLLAHPMIPLLQAASDIEVRQRYGADLDIEIDAPPAGGSDDAIDEAAAIEAAIEALTRRIADTASGLFTPNANRLSMTGFQLTRGLLGVSM
ncbi:UxaA family hydrolase [Thioalkalivibrio sp. HK1]|uniref:UxaA family hydrolase n=1 Tax=Thioalkalivibrio sp. HK1 TaxID=1469245 RepID=UPI00046FBF4F|nr:UxaA family hydrolase [Thioalkalivibrio sp. HK1]